MLLHLSNKITKKTVCYNDSVPNSVSNNNDSPIKIDKGDAKKNYLSAMIVGIVFSAAVGNIFLARKMRLFMKNSKNNYSKRSSPDNQQQTTSNSTWSQDGTAMNNQFDLRRKIELHVHLRVLGLPLTEPTKAEVKRAYREACLLHHPDRSTDSGEECEKAKQDRVKRFQEANISYTYLIRHIESKPSSSYMA